MTSGPRRGDIQKGTKGVVKTRGGRDMINGRGREE